MNEGLPCNVDAERLVLGTIILDGNQFPIVAGALPADDFVLDKHQRIYRAMMALSDRGDPIDRITLHNELMDRNEDQACGGLSYITTLDDGLPYMPNIDGYVRIIQEKAILRRAIFAARSLANRCMLAGDGATEILADATRTLDALSEASTRKQPEWRNPGEVMLSHPGGISSFLQPPKGGAGIPTAWSSLTNALCGMRKGELIVLAGRPSMGKSLVAMQIAHAAASEGHGTAVFSLEDSNSSFIGRMICCESRIDFARFRSGWLDQQERTRLNRAVGSVQDLPLWMDESTLFTVPQISSRLRRLIAQHPVEVVVVDYLQLMKGLGRSENRNQEIAAITQSLAIMAKELGVVMLLCSQLNRTCESENRRPQLSDLKESGAIEEAAHVVIFVHRWERYQKFRSREDLRGMAELIIAKQKNGQTGLLRMVFLGNQQRFEMAAGAEELTQGDDE